MAVSHAAAGESARLRRKARHLFTRTRAYRRLFFDEQGQLKPDARIVLEDLVDMAGIGKGQRELDPQVLAMAEGQRRAVLHLFGRFRLPEGRLREIQSTLQQSEDYDQ